MQRHSSALATTLRLALMASAAVVTVGAAPALAQGAAAGPDANALEELVVTAQRREERLQDVPIAVTAMTGDHMEKLGIDGSKQLSQVTPGLNFTQSVYSPQPTIRGIGTRGVGSGDESVVPIYVNGVYQPFIVGADLQFNNIERIEVLKGPQGALFGRNATGGAINIITKSPQAGFTGAASASYGRFDERIGKLYVSGGTETIAADLAVVANEDEGHIRDVLTGKRYGSMSDLAIRSQFRYTPNDIASFTFGLAHTENADTTASANIPVNGNTTARFIDPNAYVATEPYTVALGLGPVNKVFNNSASLVANFDFENFTIVSATGTQYNKLKALADSDATPSKVAELYVAQASRSYSQEVYATSAGTRKFDWIVGASYFHDNASSNPALYASGSFAASRTPPSTVVSTSFTSGATVMTTSSWAAYAQGTYHFTDAVSLTIGGRYTSDDRGFTSTTLTPVARPTTTGGETFTKFTPTANLAWRVSEQLNLYAKAGQGFKSGLFTVVNNVVRPVDPETVTQYELGFKSDPLPWLRVNGAVYYTDYEDLQTTARDAVTGGAFLQNAGGAEIYGGELELVVRPIDRLNITAGLSALHGEYVDFRDAQVNTPRTAFECRPYATPCGNSTTFQDVTGNKIIRTPFFTANLGGDYTVPLSTGELVVSGNIYYSGESFWDPVNRMREAPKTLVNSQLTWNAPSEDYSVTLWGQNLLDEEYNTTLVVSGSDTRSIARPRTYGVRLDYRW